MYVSKILNDFNFLTYDNQKLFVVTKIFCIAFAVTMFSFIGIGWLKFYMTQTCKTKGILETLLLGALAATISYFVGDLLKQLIN